MKIGIYGGTFDPIHFGHLNLALEMKEQRSLDEVWLIPANVSPHKQENPPLEARLRVKMVELAVDEIPGLKVVRYEAYHPPPSYTIDTLKHLVKGREDHFHLILGDESAKEFYRWKDPEGIVSLATLLVGSRRKERPKFKGAESVVESLNRGYTVTRNMGISATEIRKRIPEGLYIGHLVPHKVVDFIYENKLYF